MNLKNWYHLRYTTHKQVLHLSLRTTLDTLSDMLERHEVPRLPHETMLRDVWKDQKWTPLQNSSEARIYSCPFRRPRTVANGCRGLWMVANCGEHRSSVEQTHPNPKTPKVKREMFATHLGISPTWFPCPTISAQQMAEGLSTGRVWAL